MRSVVERPRLRGPVRFLVYLALQIAVLSLPFPWIAVPSFVILALGVVERLGWGSWTARSWKLLVVAALPALVGFPWAGLSAFPPDVSSWNGPLSVFLSQWEPSLVRSLRLALVLASAAWLSSVMTPVELRDALVVMLRPLGSKSSAAISRAASLTMAFIPWTGEELRRADEAARLRGSDPARRPGRHLVFQSVPLVARSLEKARRGAEALSLRDPGFGG